MPKVATLRPLLALAVLAAASPLHAAQALIEFHNTTLDHYFMTIDPAEAAAIDAGAAGPGWQRTGRTIAAFQSVSAAPAGAVVVCRFYGNQANGGPNGHFYTADAAECAAVKLDPGWLFERNEFYVQVPANGACPAGSSAVYRVYNGRYAQHDSNHRYTTDLSTYNQMLAVGWRGEGTVFCGASAAATRFKGEAWADNWFAAYVGETGVAEDSVPITTERSFNSETFFFEASYPFELNFVIKDFKENDTGLEYIGTARQQIGDGGFIMQITDTATGRVAAVSGTAMKCEVIHKAPLNPSCATQGAPTVASCGAMILGEPAGWKTAGYDTSGWESATAYTAAQVGVKEGFFDVAWNAAAKLIWTSDLKLDNTLLCKLRVTGE